jgi:hypothetical protein
LKYLILPAVFFFASLHLEAQTPPCVLKDPVATIHFGTGNVREVNSLMPYNYRRVTSSCPTDGHFTYTSYTSDCFSGDWHTITEDHTPGDADGNMMLVNASPNSGVFLMTSLIELKSNTTYEFGCWMMNVCKPSDKCPFPLLPNISVRLETAAGFVVTQFGTGELARMSEPQWTPYRAMFTTPAEPTPLTLIMTNNAPGGCGNDFALDDITFRECEKLKPPITKSTPVKKQQPKPPVVVKQLPKEPVAIKEKSKTPVVIKEQPKTNPVVKQPAKAAPPQVKKEVPADRPLQASGIGRLKTDSSARTVPARKQTGLNMPAPPAVLVSRTNHVIKRIETEAGEIKFDLYDNGQIDGDTVSIYHNNRLVVSRARLSEKPVTFRIAIDKDHPHHELIMVAENLGSIPPNTSLMILYSGTTRYEVFISSSEQKNAKIVIDLK